MKRNAVARIIVYSLILVILVSVLVCGIAAGTFAFRVDYDSETYTIGSGEVPAREIKDIEIEWASGDITIQVADVDTISFYESGDQSAPPMVYRQEGDKLTIEYQTPQVFIGFSISSSKDLIITVPQDWYCHNLSIDAASADVFINRLNANEAELNMASGESHMTDCNFVSLELDSASGEVYYSGELTTLDCNTASGNIIATLLNVPSSINFDGASADLELTLPADAGFSVEMDTLSGSFHSDFATTQHDGRYICGNGACQIDVSGMSGSITIHKSEVQIPNTR